MKNFALITGGNGLEREISLKSSSFFKKYFPYPIKVYDFPSDISRFVSDSKDIDFAIPLIHGDLGEDGKISALLDMLGIPYPFSSSEVHALCLNKFLTNSLLQVQNIPVGKQVLISQHDILHSSASEILLKYDSSISALGYPFILKPNKGGSSYYTYKIDSKEDFLTAFEEFSGVVTDNMLVQEYISGEEYSVAILDGKVIPKIMKVEKDSNIVFDYDAKYMGEDIETFPEIDEKLFGSLSELTSNIYQYVGCKDVARIDYIVREGIPYFLEINTIPGLTEQSILPKAWKLQGGEFESLCLKITGLQ